MKTDPDHDSTVMPSADDPSDTLEESIERLTETVDRHVARMDRIRMVLSRFYRATLSASSVQPVLDLAVELNPNLRQSPAPSTIIRRHLVCDVCGHRSHDDAGIATKWTRPLCAEQHFAAPMRVDSIELLPSPAVDVLTPSQVPF
jgi:hypothetical protein